MTKTDAVAVADAANGDGAGQQPVALEGQHHLRELVGQLGPDTPATDAHGREVGLVANSLSELEPAADQRPGIEQSLQIDIYHGVLLTWEAQPTQIVEGRGERRELLTVSGPG